MLKKIAAVIGLVVVGTIAAGCSAPAEPVSTPTSAPTSAAPEETETPAAEDSAHAFGETVRLEFDGSVWDVTIQAPADAPPRLAESFPLDEEGTRYVTVSGAIKRVEGPAVDPISELDVQAIVNSVFVMDEYLADDEFVSLNAAPEMLPGGEATFTQVFVVAEADEVKTVVASLGLGEAAAVAVFGESVDFGSSGE